jgi:sugar phosphate isomerase/epimerase
MHAACAADWTFITELEAAVALVESYHSPFLKLVFDTYHFGHDPAVQANLAEIVPHIGIVHLADRMSPHGLDQDRRALGKGRLELGELVRGLLEAGYVGDFDVELFGHEIEQTDNEELLRSSLEFFDRVMAPVSGT